MSNKDNKNKKKPLRFHVITIFPEALTSYLSSSMMKRAVRSGALEVYSYNPRDFATETSERPDSRPYGGGPGMVLKPGPVLKAVQKAQKKAKRGGKTRIILFKPSGKPFEAKMARSFSQNYTDLILIAGRYEGVDERVRQILKPLELSIGPYILTGGELPALIVIDAVARQREGVLGNPESLEELRRVGDRVYTRPSSFSWEGKTYRVPKVLMSGNHRDIESYRAKQGRPTGRLTR